MSPLIRILLLITAFAPNFASCGELMKAVAIIDEKRALEEVERILDDVANKISAKRNFVKEEGKEEEKDEEVAKILEEISNDALIYSMRRKSEKISEMLINFAANADPELKFTSEIVEYALKRERKSALDVLMTKNVDYTGLNNLIERTIVFAAVKYNQLDTLKKLLRKEECSQTAFLDIRERHTGKTALFYAVKLKEGGAAMAEVLLKAGASASVIDNYGCTSLLLAVQNNDLDCAILLIKYDADPSIELPNYSFVWEYARAELPSEWIDMVALLNGYEKAKGSGKDGKTYLENLGIIAR